MRYVAVLPFKGDRNQNRSHVRKIGCLEPFG
jgi:hypothetical protein